MRLICATHNLEGPGGTETYVLTLATHLQRLGHDVHLYAVNQGPMAEVARESGLRVARTLDELPDSCDAVIPNFTDVSYELVSRYPDVVQAYICHSAYFALQLPPQAGDAVQLAVALNERVHSVIAGTANLSKALRLTQPVDTNRFYPRGKLPPKPRRLLIFGNYAEGPRRDMVQEVCDELGIEAVGAGSTSNPTTRAEDTINEHDIVMGYGRCIVEAMACGRPAYVYDHHGGDGWVTPESYAALEADGFAGQATDMVVTKGRLLADFRDYSPEMGVHNRDLAVAHHQAPQHAAAIADALGAAAAPAQPVSPEQPWRELARLARVLGEFELSAFGLNRQVARMSAQIHDLESELLRLGDEYNKTALELGDARAETERVKAEAEQRHVVLQNAEAEVARREAEIDAFKETRRYRLALSLAKPMDRLRGR